MLGTRCSCSWARCSSHSFVRRCSGWASPWTWTRTWQTFLSLTTRTARGEISWSSSRTFSIISSCCRLRIFVQHLNNLKPYPVNVSVVRDDSKSRWNWSRIVLDEYILIFYFFQDEFHQSFGGRPIGGKLLLLWVLAAFENTNQVIWQKLSIMSIAWVEILGFSLGDSPWQVIKQFKWNRNRRD